MNDPTSLDELRSVVLSRIKQGHASSDSWKLTRAVWRAGQLRLTAAEPYLLALFGSGDAMLV